MLSVTVIVVGNGIGYLCSNPGQIVGQTRLFNLGTATGITVATDRATIVKSFLICSYFILNCTWTRHYDFGTPHGIIVSKQDLQIIVCEFDSHSILLTSGIVPNWDKLNKWLDIIYDTWYTKYYFKDGKRCFQNKWNPKKTSLYSGLSCSVKTWKIECNIEIGGHTKKSDKTNKKRERLQLHGKMREIRINYFTRKKNERSSNWNFQNNGIFNYGGRFKNIFPRTRTLLSRPIEKKNNKQTNSINR